SSGTC
ncbi:hypothetical protein D027_3922B, partial [Vibrio parahaemolyticus 861]